LKITLQGVSYNCSCELHLLRLPKVFGQFGLCPRYAWARKYTNDRVGWTENWESPLNVGQ